MKRRDFLMTSAMTMGARPRRGSGRQGWSTESKADRIAIIA
jgi:hypothetical protein